MLKANNTRDNSKSCRYNTEVAGCAQKHTPNKNFLPRRAERRTTSTRTTPSFMCVQSVLFSGAGAKHLWGEKSPEQRCEELVKYCRFHLKERDNFVVEGDKRIYQYNELYRIFYYDCEPLKKTVYNPLIPSKNSLTKSF